MKVDLTSEFQHLELIEFDSPQEKQEFVLQQLLKAASSVVSVVVEWSLEQPAISPILEEYPLDTLEIFLTAGLLVQLAEKQRLRAGNDMLAAYIKQKAGF